MAKIDTMIAELNELRVSENQILEKVWNHSQVASDADAELLSAENIQKRVEALAIQIIKECQEGLPPVLVGVLDGVTPFANMLCDELKARSFEYIRSDMQAGSYGKNTEAGKLTLGPLPKARLSGRKVYLLDDVCDTGETLKAIKEELSKQHPKGDITLVALVEKDLEKDKPIKLNVEIELENGKKYKKVCRSNLQGFRLERDAFLIGFGMDYREGLRHKGDIRIANLSVLTAEDKLVFKRIDELEKLIDVAIEFEKDSQKLRAPGDNSIFGMAAPTTSATSGFEPRMKQ
ncbi:MAG: hypothetical protein EPN84_06495 [Legionella sp.]|nr:MAG: hypothetical protein EPN84_06495 [Legionella sp.]